MAENKRIREGHVYRMLKDMLELGPVGKTVVKRVRMMDYEGSGPKLDIRKWSLKDDSPYAGISLSRDEAKALKTLLESSDIDVLFDEAEKTLADEKAHPFKN